MIVRYEEYQICRYFCRFRIFESKFGNGILFGNKRTVEAQIVREIEASIVERFREGKYRIKTVICP